MQKLSSFYIKSKKYQILTFYYNMDPVFYQGIEKSYSFLSLQNIAWVGLKGALGKVEEMEYFDERIDRNSDESSIRLLPVFHISVAICWSEITWDLEEGLW